LSAKFIPMTINTYIIKSTIDETFYFGQTTNLMKRLNQHNRGLDEATKNKRPWVLIAYKEFQTRGGAMSYERKLKELGSKTAIEKFVKEHDFHIV
jgi:putative endonuclease